MKDINIPSNNYLNSQKPNPRKKSEEAIESFKSLLEDKTLPENRTESHKKNEIHTLNSLLVSANELDQINPGEGIFSLIVLSLRSSLKLKDRINELEVENRKLKIELKKARSNQ